ncbi:hypothetical protein PFISCL1PPCAC_16380 [Pristionchus fissidentatus]|uniref:EGF-like domain-containing protein n=1 Tax=Pristionchus fissidentatus TaxID=1538716 RepID=A0AAV5W0B1_9BILA|nr:hypothetical protein PFISCL1PPCAC_16380 [Pristionchus fissidentatus]
MIPSASLLVDLPGYSCLLRPSPISLPFLALLLFLPQSDGCSPSWFREERSAPPMAISGDLQVIELTSSEEDDEYIRDPVPCEEVDRGWCKNGAGCTRLWSQMNYRYDPVCNCSRGYIGQRCEQPYDPHVFAAPLEVGGRSHTSLPLMSFFAALSLLTLGAALFLYKRLMREEQWELTESANTPFSNRTSSSIHRRNALCHSPFFSPDHTCLNPALSKKPGLNLNESTIEYALDATISSEVSVHPSIS